MNIESLRGDLFGGATAAIVALPLALAFGVASGAGALAGLYGAIFAGFLAALLGGTRVQVTGPTGPMTVVMAAIVVQFSGNPAAAFAVVVLAGIFQVLIGLLGIGRYIKLAPQPVVSGFMSGIGLIIIIVQLAPVLGSDNASGPILVKLTQLPAMASELNPGALAIAMATLAINLFMPRRIARIVPAPLIALLVGTLAVAAFAIDVPLIGEVPSGLPGLIHPNIAISDVPFLLEFALILAFLGAIDSLLTSLVADSITRSQHNSNRELIGQGVGNLVAGLFGGIPSAGATMRTLVNVRSGGNSRLSGAIHALLLLVMMIGFGDVVSRIPLAVLAGILLKVGIDIVDWRVLKRVFSLPRADVVVMISTLLLTVLVDLMTAVAVGFVLASVLFVARAAETQTRNARFVFGADEVDDITPAEQNILDSCNGRLVLFHVEGPLSFGSARDISRIMLTEIDKDILAIDFSDVPFIDSSAAAALDEVILSLGADDDIVMLYGVRPQVLRTLEQTGTIAHLGEQRIFATRIEALTAARSLIEERQARVPVSD
ncbi:MAG TPA: SulP family inorganic anion transporter [Gammaproteobacteria bacterium]|nr:SulP family inorganic anion transporter [Gammaproteobacteria bacterium]